MLRILRTVAYALRRPRIAAIGVREFRSALGLSWDDEPGKSEAYDAGRELAHIATLRRFDW